VPVIQAAAQVYLLSKGRSPLLRYWATRRLSTFRARYNPVVEHLNGLRWDEEKRLYTWLIDYCGAEDTPYVRAVGRKMLLAAVRRAKKPGCKYDTVPVLEGPQGGMKSSLIKILAYREEWYSDTPILFMPAKEVQEALDGIWFLEICELEKMRPWQLAKVKAMITRTKDSARRPYDKFRSDQMRLGTFIATTNDDKYLSDPTGNRRWWPVLVGMIDLAGVAKVRDQLFAEAVVAEATGESLELPPELWPVHAEVTGARMEVDPWIAKVEKAIERQMPSVRKGVTYSAQIAAVTVDGETVEYRVASDWLLSKIGVPLDDRDAGKFRRLRPVMEGLGWSYSETSVRIGGRGVKGYTKREECIGSRSSDTPLAEVVPLETVSSFRRRF
jgi:predicted P-loop ATPase